MSYKWAGENDFTAIETKINKIKKYLAAARGEAAKSPYHGGKIYCQPGTIRDRTKAIFKAAKKLADAIEEGELAELCLKQATKEAGEKK